RLYPDVSSAPLLQKRKVLNGIWLAALIVVVLLHMMIVTAGISSHEIEATWPHVLVLVAAMLALSAKTLSEGFALSREIERYQEYRAAVKDLKRAFEAATTPREKVTLMREMERAAFEEMRAFLRSNEEALFLL